MIEDKKVGKERTQAAVRNEQWSDERIKALESGHDNNKDTSP